MKRRAKGKGTDRSLILGIRMTPELKRDLKAEAAQQGITVARLFEEVWQTYKSHQKTKSLDHGR